MLKNVNFTLNKPIRVPNYAKLRRNQCSGIVPPLSPPYSCHPFASLFVLPFAPLFVPHFHTSAHKVKNWQKSSFLTESMIINVPQRAAPPFCPPFSQIRKVQNVLYILTIYHFPPKCFVLSVQSHFLKTN